MTLDQLAQLHWMVLGSVGLVSIGLGALMHKTHFCTMGAVSDWVLMGDTTRAKQWVLAVAVAVLGLGGLSWLGWVSPLNSIYAGAQLPWLSFLLGGLMFGPGMVLGSGCSSKSLIRLGAGNLKSLVVLMAMGISALATLKGLTAVLRVNLMDTVSVGTGPGPFLGQWLASASSLPLPLAWWARPRPRRLPSRTV